MSNTISKLFGLPALYKGFIVGCEFEIESVKGFDNLFPISGLTADVDPSLRNYGHELITAPTTIEYAVELHKKVLEKTSFFNKKEAFSFRTSTHVHVNFLDQSPEKTLQFIYLYCVLEPFFFKFVDETRQNNIFCVPLYATTQYKHFSKNLNYLTKDGYWHKYAAFNILPLRSQGTIEFRHLEGTPNSAKVEAWLKLIKALYDFNLTQDLNFKDQNTLTYIMKNLGVFGFTATPADEELMRSIFIDIYLALTQPNLNVMFNAPVTTAEDDF